MLQIQWVWKNLKGYRGRYILCIILSAIFPCMMIINPKISQTLIDRVIVGTVDAAGNVVREVEILVPLAMLMIGVTLVRTVLSYISNLLTDVASQGFIYNMRRRIYNNLQNQEMGFFDRFRTGDLMTRLTGDLEMVRHAIAWIFRQLVICVVLFTATTVFYFTLNARFTLFMLAITPLLFILSAFYFKTIRPHYIRARESLADLNTRAQENIEGNRVVKAFANEQYEIDEFGRRNAAYRDINLKTNLVWMKFYPVIELVANTMSIVVLLAGGIFLIKGWLTPGELSAFSMLTWALSDPLRTLGVMLNDFQRFFASVDKVMEVYYQSPTIQSREGGAVKRETFNARIEFKNVTFAFRDQTVLENVSFVIEPGQTVAIMGETGSGKTTIVNLIARFYDVTSGEILVDGIDVRFWNLKSLREKIGVATQDVFLFSDTVEGNIAYGNEEMTFEEVREAARRASAEFIVKMPEGFDTIIGERGVGLSGGQRQRIALARALATKPPILILDDTTSAVDMETEEVIQHNLDTLDFSCTKIVIAQRISSVRGADKIIVLRDKKIEEMGTHQELVASRGYYYEICRIQSYGADAGKAGA